jgi:hypothetical protein
MFISGATMRSDMENDASSVVLIVTHGAELGALTRLVSLDGVPR